MTNLLEVRNGLVHAESPNGNDYTLCGITSENTISDMSEYDADAETETEPYMLKTRKKITCSYCAGIIRHCHKIRLSSIGETEAEI